MKKIYLLLIFCFGCLISFSQNTEIEKYKCNSIKINSQLEENIVVVEKEIKDNIWIKYQSINIKDKLSFVNNLPEGTYRIKSIKDKKITISNSLKLNCKDSSFDKTKIIKSINPNPNRGVFKLELEKTSNKNLTAIVYNSLGIVKEELKIESNNLTVDLSNLESGIYFISIYEGEKLLEIKNLIIQK